MEYISPTPIEDEVRSLVVALVSRAVTRTYTDAQVLPFGSYETKLYLPLGYATSVPSLQYLTDTSGVTVILTLSYTPSLWRAWTGSPSSTLWPIL